MPQSDQGISKDRYTVIPRTGDIFAAWGFVVADKRRADQTTLAQ